MDTENLYGVADLLSFFHDEEPGSYVVDVSNPVCPCCGAKLILNDGKVAAETDDLATDSIQERYVTAEDTLPLVDETAEEIVEAYMDTEDACDLNELIVITDKRLKHAIHRKSLELQSVLELNYDIKIDIELLESYIKKAIRYIVSHNDKYR